MQCNKNKDTPQSIPRDYLKNPGKHFSPLKKYQKMLPGNLLKVLEITTDKLKWNPDFTMLPMMVVASAAIGGSRESKAFGYPVKSILFGCNVGNPGVNKSEPAKFAVQPLNDLFHKEVEAWERDYQGWENLDNDIKKLQPKPELKESIVSDVTIERLGMALKKTPRGILMYRDELKGWFGSFGRYTKNSSEEADYLTLFDGGSYSASRVTRESIHIKEPYLSILGTTQPDTFFRSFHGYTDNGLKERILYVFPEAKPQPWSLEATDEARQKAADLWKGIVLPLKDLKGNVSDDGKESPEQVPFTQDAMKILHKWNLKNTERIESQPQGAGIYAKANIMILRFALILQLIEHPNSLEIAKENAQRAIELIECFLTHTKKVIRTVFEGTETDPTTAKRLFDALPEIFTTEQALRVGHEKLEISESTVKRNLKDPFFFKKLGHGRYSKETL